MDNHTKYDCEDIELERQLTESSRLLLEQTTTLEQIEYRKYIEKKNINHHGDLLINEYENIKLENQLVKSSRISLEQATILEYIEYNNYIKNKNIRNHDRLSSLEYSINESEIKLNTDLPLFISNELSSYNDLRRFKQQSKLNPNAPVFVPNHVDRYTSC